MAVTSGYLAKMRRALRIGQSADIDAEITDLIEECRLDLQKLGVIKTKTDDETDSLILGAVRGFIRWKFGLSNPDADRMREEYYLMRDELRRRRDYIGYVITFVVKASGVAVADAVVTFNGETKETDSSGTAVFYYVSAGVNQEYTVSATGYVSQTVDLDVTASATVNIALVVG